jgi:hypothetical protein
MTKLYLYKSSEVEITRVADSDDDWDRDDTYTTWDFDQVSLDKPLHIFDTESFETGFDVNKGDVLHVVVAVWSDGNSFGHDSGRNSEVFGCFKTYEEAEELQNNLEEKNGYKPHQLPWDGYFESLDYISILTRTVI